MTATSRGRWQGLRAWIGGREDSVASAAQGEAAYAAARQRAAELLYVRNRLEAEGARLRRELGRLSPSDPRRQRLAREAATLEVQARDIRARAEDAKARLLELRDALRSLERHRLLARAAEADERTASDVDLLTAEMQLDRELGRDRDR